MAFLYALAPPQCQRTLEHGRPNGRRFRTLTTVDDRTGACLALESALSMTADALVAVRDRVVAELGKPKTIVRGQNEGGRHR